MERNIYEYNPNVVEAPQSAALSTSSLMTKVYLWMTMALAVSSTLDWALTYIGVFLFCGLTAYDTQKMKEILRQSEGAGDTNMLKIALLCSLSLYLDFINLFLYLLRIFGDRRS